MKDTRKNWTRDELILAFNIYCKIPFSKINHKQPLICELAHALGRTPSALAWKLVNFASLDPILKKRNIKGASNCSKLDKLIFEEFNNDWEKLVSESETKLMQLLGINSDKDNDIQYNERIGKEKLSTVKTRTNQNFFRKAVLAAYDNKCCITGIFIPELLVASHIVPWSKDEKNRLNPSNGLCLNNLHDKAFDKAFDKGLITIDFDYKIKISKFFNDFKNNESIDKFFIDLNNIKISLPKRFMPCEEFLDYHHREIFIK